MDYGAFVAAHREANADITVSALPMDEERAEAFGLMKIDDMEYTASAFRAHSSSRSLPAASSAGACAKGGHESPRRAAAARGPGAHSQRCRRVHMKMLSPPMPPMPPSSASRAEALPAGGDAKASALRDASRSRRRSSSVRRASVVSRASAAALAAAALEEADGAPTLRG